ncbi:MAG: ribosome maturation factor RimP [Gaiellaceae bacterium]
MATTHETEKQLQRDISRRLSAALPEVEVLAVELQSPNRFCVYIDHAQGVDHGLCERVTNVLRGYLDRYTVDVSSPGVERPLRTPAHFQRVVGRKAALRTADEIGGRRKFKGEVVDADAKGIRLSADGTEHAIPYDAIVRANLIEEDMR